MTPTLPYPRLSTWEMTGLDRSPGPIVRIISKARLVEFWTTRQTEDECRIAERRFMAWYRIAIGCLWENFGALKQTFGSADAVGNCVVFDVGNNRYRLIGRVNYRAKIIYVLKVMDHEEYDGGTWAESCGCHRPPPIKRRSKQAPAPEAPAARRKRKRPARE